MKIAVIFSSFLLAVSLSLSAADPALTLPGADGEEHTPLTIGDKKAVVLFFVSAYCPTSNTFVKEMNQIAADYGDKIAFDFVHSDSDLKLTDILQHTEMNEIKATVLIDKDQRLATLTHATITPEVAVLSPTGSTLYQGRINDLYLGPTKRQRQATTKDLRDALDAILANKPVAQPKTEAVGCKISGIK
jgi:protein-disulfide isomerase